jgi:hypothetical protein
MIATVYTHKRRAMWLACALLLAGCTTRGRIGALPTIPNPTDAAEIVVIREWRFAGAAHTVSIILDGAPVYGINSNEHVIIPVPAGNRLISAAAGWSESTSLVQAAAQQRYYFRIVTGLSGYGFRLELISAEVGQALMAKTTRISP